jgi:septal ring factor EnvC (AmiA/AmiB activator)
MIADMAIALGVLIVLVALALSLWLAYSAQTQVRQLRRELDQSQSMLNEARQRIADVQRDLASVRQSVVDVQDDVSHARDQLGELRAAAEVLPPPLPRARRTSGGLEDLREQLRAAHREEEGTSEE